MRQSLPWYVIGFKHKYYEIPDMCIKDSLTSRDISNLKFIANNFPEYREGILAREILQKYYG